MKIEIKPNYHPHPGQRKLHNSKARFKVCAMGRRWGKTLACVYEILSYAINNPNSMCMWVAPVYGQTQIAWRLMSNIPPEIIKRKTITNMEIDLINGSLIKLASGEKWENLKGHGIDFLVIDEAAMMRPEAWQEALRPALADTLGGAIFIFTPRGKGTWTHELFMRGLDESKPEYESFTFPTVNNPYIDAGEIEEYKLNYPDRLYRQEFLAEFLEDGAGVFRSYREAMRGYIQPNPVEARRYVIGIDVARKVDWTVLSVIDVETRQFVAFDRFNKIDWPYQEHRILAMAQKWNDALIVIDSTGVGDPVYQGLKKAGAKIKPFQFTSESKKNLIETAVIEIEFERVHLPVDIPEVFLHELDVFGFEITKAGNVTYGAPSGHHDDCVISMCLAIWEISAKAPFRLEVA